MKTYALLLAALSFFIAAPSSADVLWQFDGVCTIATWDLDHINVPCSEVADPSVHAMVVLEDDGLIKSFSYIDHVQGSPLFIALDHPDGFGTLPDGITVFIGDDGNFHTVDENFGFACEFCSGIGVHLVEGSGVWTRVPEPATLALLAFGFASVAATRRRRLGTANATD